MRFLVAGSVLSLCVTAWWILGDATRHLSVHLALYGAAFTAYLVALTGAPRLRGRPLAWALGVAVVWRVLLVGTPPLLSDDVFRYVWEGRVQIAGGNPYAWQDRPDSDRWLELRDDVWRGVNHKSYTAVYPPLWQLAARMVVSLDDSIVAMKLFVVLLELLMWWVLVAALRTRGQPIGRVLVVAWSPLALVEIAGSGHNDVLGLLFVSLALLALARGRPREAALASALGFQAKLLPGLVSLAWWRRFRWPDALLALLVAFALVLPYWSAGDGLVRSLGAYGRHWLFNETLFVVLRAIGGGHIGGVVLGALLTLGVAWIVGKRDTEPALGGLLVVATFIVVSANVLPWYALWLLPFLVLRDSPGALLFTGTIGLAYLVLPEWQSGEPWQVGWAVRAVEYGAPLAVASIGLRR